MPTKSLVMDVLESDKPSKVVCDNFSPSGKDYTILLVDDEKLGRMIAKRRLNKLHYRMLEAENGREALEILQREKVDLVLSDWMMPELDGPGLCKAIKQDQRFRSIHFILMTALDQPAQIAEGLTRGADDFLPKSASDQEVLARVRAGLRARQLLLDLEESYRVITEKQAQLDAELYSASEFVRSLLPVQGAAAPGIQLAWEFLPSSQLGGDLFQVTKWGDDHLGIMVLDMSGHGTGPALRAVSLAMWFKGAHIARSFPGYDPGEIVTCLNSENPMTDQGDYFTVWVGVLQLSTRVLRFASAGHPGSILVRNDTGSVVLGGKTYPTGFSPDEIYHTESITLADKDRLYLFTDGIYEVVNGEDEIWGRHRLQKALESIYARSLKSGLKSLIDSSRSWQVDGIFGDDVALIGLELHAEFKEKD
ncbi:MAG: PP2C family protein-serine/threonine phosphatase [Nitrospirota bacterium]